MQTRPTINVGRQCFMTYTQKTIENIRLVERTALKEFKLKKNKSK